MRREAGVIGVFGDVSLAAQAVRALRAEGMEVRAAMPAPFPELVRALDRILILHADHEQNASTSTVRLVGSSGAMRGHRMSSTTWSIAVMRTVPAGLSPMSATAAIAARFPLIRVSIFLRTTINKT